MIETFEARFPEGRASMHARFRSSVGDGTLPSGTVAKVAPLIPYANGGRWVVDCPDCSGAELMADDGLFFCCECRNATVSHAYRPVQLPVETVRRQVEAYLSARPDPATRNWKGEPVKQLQQENRERGIRIP